VCATPRTSQSTATAISNPAVCRHVDADRARGGMQGGVAIGGQRAIGLSKGARVAGENIRRRTTAGRRQFYKAFATVIVTHSSPRCSLANTVDELSARRSRIAFAGFAAGRCGLFGTQMGQHWPAALQRACHLYTGHTLAFTGRWHSTPRPDNRLAAIAADNNRGNRCCRRRPIRHLHPQRGLAPCSATPRAPAPGAPAIRHGAAGLSRDYATRAGTRGAKRFRGT